MPARPKQRPQAPPAAPCTAPYPTLSTRLFPLLFPLLLLAAALVAYLPALHGDFIWDDGAWTTKSEFYLRDLAGLWSIWTDTTAMQQYFPVTATSFWLDWQLWHEWTLPYHLENVFLHALGGILLWRVLLRLAIPGAALATALFTLHPMMVESVAWITERKNTLSLVLLLGGLLAYLRFEQEAEKKAQHLHFRISDFSFFYFLALLLFIAALLAKITAFILPPAILLIVWWKKGRLGWKQHLLPTLPFFIAALALGLLVHWLEKHHVGAQGSDFSAGLAQRSALAGHIFWHYPAQLLWPADLRLFYPKWPIATGSPSDWIFSLLALVSLIALGWARKRPAGRAALLSVLLYLIGIFPLLGFLDVYGMFIADVADRWAYLPSISLITLTAAALTRWLTPRWLPWLLLPILGTLTWNHAKHYAHEKTFWRSALVHNPDAWIACNNLGTLLAQNEQYEEAAPHLRRAVELRPDYAEAYCNLANLQRETGHVEQALTTYQQALELRPDDYPDAHNNYGLTLLQNGRHAEAETHFRRAIEIQPLHALAHNNLGNYHLQSGHPDEALTSYLRALQVNPNYSDAHNNTGMAYLNQNKPQEAIPALQRAIELRPDYAEAINNLGHALLQLDQPREAVNHFEKAAQIRPDYAQAYHNLAIARYLLAEVPQSIAAYEKAIAANPQQLGSINNLAWILATYPDAALRDGKKALKLATHASTLTSHREPTVLHTLAAAQAESGHFTDAALTARQSLDLALAQNNATLATAIRAQLRLYESQQPFRDEAPMPSR